MESINNFWERIGVNRAVLALSSARMADAVGNSILFIILPLYIAKVPSLYFNFSLPVLVGILISIYGFINSFSQPIMGALTDKLGTKKLLIQAGLAVLGICTFSFIFAGHFFDLLILRTFQGVAVAITIPPSMALMAAITKKESRGGSMGVYSTLRMVGFTTGPLIGGYLQAHFGFNAAFYAGTGFILLSMILVQIWVEDVKIPVDPNKKRKFQLIDKKLLSPGIVSAGISTFLMAAAFSMVTTLENEFNKKLDITAVGFSIAFSTLMIGRLIFQVPLGHYSDKVGRRPLIIGGLIFMAPATALLGIINTLPQFVIVRLLQGIASAGIAAPAFAVAADLAKRGGEGRQMSIITMGFGLGISFGPLLAGLLANFSLELPFLIGGILTLLGALIVYRYMPETVNVETAVFKN